MGGGGGGGVFSIPRSLRPSHLAIVRDTSRGEGIEIERKPFLASRTHHKDDLRHGDVPYGRMIDPRDRQAREIKVEAPGVLSEGNGAYGEVRGRGTVQQREGSEVQAQLSGSEAQERISGVTCPARERVPPSNALSNRLLCKNPLFLPRKLRGSSDPITGGGNEE